ncbi:nucleotidyltransferase domain-containing protein [Nakamurella endophytica]|uniref:Nucleotidyltransferase n=1 Tax=Nakamurella endophytica TaxID=1748367 RepID=A0A917T8B6_9ACTN|nr:nucleotidyltransferase [Nakamurella endophytica]GGM11310.1 hypothetical protein GCM10011594_34100 [Nakamurella endophytica]
MTAAPKSVASAFETFNSNISLNPADRARAEHRHRDVASVLADARLAASTFLQGSFARKTMRKPLKDVDIVVVLPAEMEPRWRTASGARTVHELFKEPLRRRYGAKMSFDQTAQAGKALQLCFDDVDFTIDLVAAFDTGDPNWVDIANRHEGLWEPSNIRQLVRVVAERNQATDGRFIHQVRMVKEAVAQDDRLDGLCGLATESLTYAAVTQKMPHLRAVAATLRYAATAVAGQVLDPTGVDDLSAKWTPQQRAAWAYALDVAARRAEEALRLERDGQFTDAIATWSALLGEDFPDAPAGQSAADMIAAMASGGTVTSTGRVTSSVHGAGGGRPVRAWRTR